MKTILGFQDCLEVVQDGVQPLEENPTDAQRLEFMEAKKKDCKSTFLIHQCKVKLHMMRRKYEWLQMEKQENVADYFTRIRSLTNLMKSCGEQIPKQGIVEKILKTLSIKYDRVIVAIKESKDLGSLKIDELQGSLEAHERRFLERMCDRQSQQALSVQFKKRNLRHNDKQRKENKRLHTNKKNEAENVQGYGQRSNKLNSANQGYDSETRNTRKCSSYNNGINGKKKKYKSKNLETVLERCVETNLVLNWEKCHFMVTKGIVLGHKISRKGIEVDKAKLEVIEKLPPPTNVKGIRSFLGHARFYRCFIKDFSKTAKPFFQSSP
ncbi:PREDICTED: uncharacterized protein LOC109359927 [Lupinus angustifolius]|uniref:uncharacterized protein LOC109359927 n=1 Tax=Lupinus angustifolius TaxID=3871 RepID=UPI00092EEE84|nr:PREDICTED: uncharacterized protein LOC109359927 [Lupinus angustifolius]